MTRSRSLLVNVLLSCLLLSQAQGICFDKLFKSIIHVHDIKEKESTLIIKSDAEKASLAKEEHPSSLSPSPSSGNNRKLLTDPKTSHSSSTSTSSTTSKNDHKNEDFKAKTPSLTTASNGGEQEEKFMNVKPESYAEIAEMDYSPARRKPPIHN